MSEYPLNMIQLEKYKKTMVSSFPMTKAIAMMWTDWSEPIFFMSPFPLKIVWEQSLSTYASSLTTSSNYFGFVLQTSDLNNRDFVSEVLNESDPTSPCKPKNTKNFPSMYTLWQ